MLKRVSFAFLILVMLGYGIPAQSATLLSNLGNATGGGYGGVPDSADHFQTGAEVLSVTAINVLWESLGSVPGVNRVLIYTDDGGFPSGTTVGTPFTNPNVTTVGVMVYSGMAVLEPGTVYWMVVDIDDNSDVAYTYDHSYVSDPSTGGAQMLEGSAWGNNETGYWNEDDNDLKYEVIGDAGQVLIFEDGFESDDTSAWSATVS